jgi:FkbM family methyltransferase
LGSLRYSRPAMRHRRWSGVLVEPVRELRAKCERRRRQAQVFGYALVGPDHAGAEVTIHFGDLMSTIVSPNHATQGLEVAGRAAYSEVVPARTVSSVLDEASLDEVDLMVLALEGQERAALEGLDIERHAPRLLLVEALDAAASRAMFDPLLAARYEPGPPLSPFDLLYQRVG